MTGNPWTRRGAGVGLAALAAACAVRPKTPPILVNLAGAQAPPPSPDAAPANGAPTAADLAGRVTVGVFINGQGPFDFVVDSGANRTVLSAELAQALQLPPMDPAPVHGIAGVEPAPTARVDELRVGLVRTKKLRLPVLPRARLGVDGLLGVDALRDRLVRIDFLRRELKIEMSEGRRGADVNPFDMRRNASGALPEVTSREVVVPAQFRFGQLIIVAADVAGRPVTAFLDSGSQSTVGNLALRRAVLGTRPDPKLRRYMTPLYSATGQTAEGELAELPPLHIGGLTLRSVLAAFADLHVFDLWRLQDRPTILIGVDVMKAFEAVTLDFGRREVVFTLPARRR